MYLLRVDIRPTAALTFRILPGSILDITTYPFVPPTTLSGFLRRVAMLAAKGNLPGTEVDDAPYYVLPSSLVTLGAYPLPGRRGTVHRTHRKGVKDFTDTSFTHLRVTGKEHPTFQLHTWEYLITDRLQGYVVTEEPSAFEPLRQIKGYGCKLGKEGFAYIEEVTEPVALQQINQSAQPATVVPAATIIDAVPECPFDLYTLYSFVWEQKQRATSSPSSDQRSLVHGYKPFSAAWCEEGRPVRLDYWSTGELFFPADLVTVLRGGDL